MLGSVFKWLGVLVTALVGWVPMVFAWLAAKRKVESDANEEAAKRAKRAAEIDETTDDLGHEQRARWLYKGRPDR